MKCSNTHPKTGNYGCSATAKPCQWFFGRNLQEVHMQKKEKLATLSRGSNFIPEKDFPIEGQAFTMAARIWISLSSLESMTSLVFTASFNVNSSLLRNRTG